jgi:hypothetical protein
MKHLLFAHMKPIEAMRFPSEDVSPRIDHEEQVVTYKPAYDWVLDQIHDQIRDFHKNNYNPKKLILGAETYLQMVSSLSFHSDGFVKPTEYWGLEIILKPGHGIDVVGTNETELSRQYWGKKNV